MVNRTLINLPIIFFTVCFSVSNMGVWAAENTRTIEEHKVIEHEHKEHK